MTITVSTTDRRDGKALALFARCSEWQRGKTKDGRSFFAIPGSQPGLFHMTDTRKCSCYDFQQSHNVCKHVRAVRLWMAAFKTGVVAPRPRPTATLEDQRVALLPAGAEYLAAQNSTETTVADIDGSRAYLTKLLADQAAHVAVLRARGADPEIDPTYRQRAEWIAGLEARHRRQERDAAPRPARRDYRELLAVE